METNIGNGRWSKDNPKAVRARNCEICKEAKLGLGIRWGETDEYCPICKKVTPVYYKPDGAFVRNHCTVCHDGKVEGAQTLASACH